MLSVMNSLALVFALTLAQAPANNQGQIVPLQKVESGVSAKETSVKEDGAEAASADVHESAESFDLNEVINHHLGDVRLRDFYIMGYNFPITKRVAMMWVAMTLLLVILIPAARSISRNAAKRPGRFTSMIEVFVTFIRQDVGENTMGHHSRSYEPFLLTLFFFILFCNLIGLIPPMGEIAVKAGELFGYQFHLEPGDIPLPLKIWSGITPTGDLSVTATLAITSFFIIQISGLVYQGIAYIKNIVPAGIPWIMWPILWPIEVLGQFTKPFALAIRLLANMTAGHMIILVFLGFIFQFQQLAIIPLSISISVAIYLLEIFVALLQAYIFVFLTALFIAGSQHRH